MRIHFKLESVFDAPRTFDFLAAGLIAVVLMAPLWQTQPIPWPDRTSPAPVVAVEHTAPLPEGLFRLLSSMNETPTVSSPELTQMETAIENRWTEGDPRRQKALRKVLRKMATPSRQAQ